MLASHEVGTSPKSSKSMYMVSGLMLVEGYSMKQQSAVVVSECDLSSFETRRKASTRDDQVPTVSLLSIEKETSVKHSEPSSHV